jgi:predicted HicB family RNase H-like nuclease
MSYKGYLSSITYSAEDKCLVGRILGINDVIAFHADSAKELQQVFEETVDDYLATCARIGREPNKPYSGRVTLRMPPELHAKLAALAEAAGDSLNHWMVKALSQSVAQRP